MAIEYLDNGNTDGTVLGQSATEKIAFYNATPIVRPAGATLVTTVGAVNTTNLRTSLNAVIEILNNLGLNATASGYL